MHTNFQSQIAFGSVHGTQEGRLITGLGVLLYAASMVLSVALVVWSVGGNADTGLPIRVILSFSAFGLFMIGRLSVVLWAIQYHKYAITVITAAGVLGSFVSMMNGTPPDIFGRELAEIHVQAIVLLILTTCVVELYGLRFAANIFFLAFGLSAFFALGQFVGIGFFWDIPGRLLDLQGAILERKEQTVAQERPIGLSYSAVHLATHMVFTFCIIYFLRVAKLGRRILAGPDPYVMAALGLMVFFCFISGNRSPILGAVIFAALYMVIKSPRYAILMACLSIVVLPIIAPQILENAGDNVRVLSTDDGSAMGRAPLRMHGYLLFLSNPFGYGFAFDSTLYADQNWQIIKEFEYPLGIYRHALHCYQLMVLNKYGLGIVLILAMTLWGMMNRFWIAFPMLIYAVHITYHNAGPLNGEFLFWPVLAIMGGAIREAHQRHQGLLPVRKIRRARS